MEPISFKESSRAKTARLKPMDFTRLIPSALERVIWVLAWISWLGATARISLASPMSWIIKASGFKEISFSRNSGSSWISRSNTSTFMARNVRTLRLRAYRIISATSSNVKSSVRPRAFQWGTPKYTASAPLLMAAMSMSRVPTGSSSSGFFTIKK